VNVTAIGLLYCEAAVGTVIEEGVAERVRLSPTVAVSATLVVAAVGPAANADWNGRATIMVARTKMREVLIFDRVIVDLLSPAP
jgi:hypothetical protein